MNGSNRFTRRIVIFVIGALCTIGSTPTYADVPDSISYQGVLNTSAGLPVADGNYTVTISIYDAAVAGTTQWTETKTVSTVEGLFTTFLGSVIALPSSVFSGPNRWLGITVASDPEMTPRTAIVAVPYAYRIETVDGATPGAISGNHALVSNSTGNFNTASGVDALFGNTTGNFNTAIGRNALQSNTTGEGNTASGAGALRNNTTGFDNTAGGMRALYSNTTGERNTASGDHALQSNTIGGRNTAIGWLADVSSGDLTNATAIGATAVVDASNKIRLGNSAVAVIEGPVAYTFTSDRNQKENFQPVDGDAVLRKLRELNLTSWNYKGNNPLQFRHYGPVAQDFFEAFGHDGVGTSGTPTTINSGDMAGILMIAVQALEKQNQELTATIQNLTLRLETVESTASSTHK